MIFDELTKEQEKAVRALERALKKCRDANVAFADLYGSLEAFDGNITGSSPVGFDVTEYPLRDQSNHGRRIKQSGCDFDSFADDEIEHYVQFKHGTGKSGYNERNKIQSKR